MSDVKLTEETSVAYQTFQAMRESKQTYFLFLKDIDVKYKGGDETGELAKILNKHSEKVATFNDAMSAVEGFEARDALIKLMS